jgi:hypothetical protein
MQMQVLAIAERNVSGTLEASQIAGRLPDQNSNGTYAPNLHHQQVKTVELMSLKETIRQPAGILFQAS